MVVSRDRTPFLADGRADMNRSPNSANHRRRLRAYVGLEPSDPVDKVSNNSHSHLGCFWSFATGEPFLYQRHLRHDPRKVSRSRIKRLRGVRRPQFRLRVGEIRVFYDVSD